MDFLAGYMRSGLTPAASTQITLNAIWDVFCVVPLLLKLLFTLAEKVAIQGPSSTFRNWSFSVILSAIPFSLAFASESLLAFRCNFILQGIFVRQLEASLVTLILGLFLTWFAFKDTDCTETRGGSHKELPV